MIGLRTLLKRVHGPLLYSLGGIPTLRARDTRFVLIKTRGLKGPLRRCKMTFRPESEGLGVFTTVTVSLRTLHSGISVRFSIQCGL